MNFGVDLFLDLVKVDVGHVRPITIEDPGDLFQGGPLGLDVDEVYEHELAKVPEL